ncbi:MAG: thermonuclease family protein [Croceibacterium sp.]
MEWLGMGAGPLSDIPPPPPGFKVDGPKQSKPVKSATPLPFPRGAISAIDGDTVRPEQGADWRLLGVDAPELRQQGYTQDGGAVPVGQRSRNALVDLIQSSSPQFGQVVGKSYGRNVGPVTAGGADVGNALVRDGNAFAAPDYLSSDPTRRFDYMQSERLARINRLGVHDTFTQPPAEYRDNPDYVPSREAVAQFFDTPTPVAGMRPEAEKRYLDLILGDGTAEQVVQFVESQGGFKVDPAAVQAFIRTREAARAKGQALTADGVSYDLLPMPLTDLGDGATGSAIRGFGSGFLASGLDEAGAVADMLGGTDGRENVWNSDRRLADIWQNNQQQNASILGYDETAHPYATTGGNLAGAVTSGFMIPYGAGATTVPQLARVGAVYGAAEGFLGADGGLVDRAQGAIIGAPVGAVANALGAKALEAAAPLVRSGLERLAPAAQRLRGAVGFGGREAAAVPDGAGQALPGVEASGGAQGAAQAMPGDVPHPPEGFALDRPESVGMAAEQMPSVSGDLRQRDYLDLTPGAVRPQRMDEPLAPAQVQAVAGDLQPRDVLPVASNEVASVEEAAARDAGRYVPARAPNERGELARTTVRNFMGKEVPKVGPIDLVEWVRLRGGINDAGDGVTKGGDLRGMGMTNAPRRGMDFVGQEARFGPLINNNDGMTLDDAALAAWEAGYFPELTERPSINQFLEGLRETQDNGANRRFLPEDMPQIERFYGAQSERYSLQEQRFETGAEVYQDRSTPANEPQPFAPPEAYVEWPSDSIRRAGNIDVTRLESPQDIARALKTTVDRVGFDAATRGRVTQAETEALAADLGMTADNLLSRRKGQALNAEEALAARQILARSGNELVNVARRVQAFEEPGGDLLAEFRQKWMRHVAIQEQVAGMTAEAGRALQQFKMVAKSGAARGPVLGALVRGGGGRDGLKGAAETLLDAVEAGPGVFNTLAEQAAKPKFRHKLSELYINMLLSGPQTHAVNIASNTLTSLAQIPEFAGGALVGAARQAFSRSAIDRVTASEVGARAFGLLQGAKEGAVLFARALRTGNASDFISKVEGDEFRAISGLKGEVIRIPTRLLTAEDELFKGVARRMELSAQAVRLARSEGLRGEAAAARIADLTANPTEEMMVAAFDYGRYLTFQRSLGPVASKVSAITSESLPAKVFLPFVRTPTNLLKFAAERSPAAPLLQEWRKEFAAGGASRDMAIARAVIGTGFGVAIYEAALAGRVTGSAPSDPAKSRLFYADGRKPYSVKIGDRWYSYKRLDPFSTTVGVAADMATLPDGMSERQRDDKATLVVASIMGNLADKSWLSGISGLISALHEPDRYAGNLLERLAGSFLIPTGAAQLARTLDPVQRETGSVGEALINRVPGASQSLLPRRDIWGREVVSEGGLGPDMISPVWVSTQLDDPVNVELMQLDYAPGYPPRKVGGVELTPEQYDSYLAASGKASHDGLSVLVQSPEWRGLDDEAKVKAARRIVADARAEARASTFGGKRSSPAGAGRSSGSVPAPPEGFKIEGESAGRNVFRDLQAAIPGVGITSGFRTQAYQADMAKRGYHPAANSGHLDGSSLDLTPPAGRSLDWLAQQVKRYDPAARVLVEGDHVHTTFPGYYGAPAIGGARSAGLRNPLEGVPPPPSGFTVK